MFDVRFLRPLREARSWSQADVAAATGINQPRVSLYERSERQPSRRHMERLELALAMGEAREGEERPLYALAIRTDARALQLALTTGPRVGVYRKSEFGADAAGIVRRIHPGKAGAIGLVPVWLEAAFGAVVAAKTGGVRPDDVYFVDSSLEPARIVAAVTKYAISVADWLCELEASTPGVDISALADALLKDGR